MSSPQSAIIARDGSKGNSLVSRQRPPAAARLFLRLETGASLPARQIMLDTLLRTRVYTMIMRLYQ